ncbi:hypothetical protein BKA59DRAFT_529242 [Fusarium tricinctum]|uniref:BTB domain-containing protein n=1 Tax=Fusarium tricinctum TaxID=61284 RepID=A0A8K0RX52_9HYPO|nr:hypothetical protein BKA59DRAFT_529242 [Fusarium tricinctum]
MSVPSLAPADQGTKVQEILQIGEDGDTILVVGPDKAKIQVLSSFLKHISPVFRAMLDSSMSEGEAFRNRVDNFPIEIILPEDKPRAMFQMLRGLYGVDASCRPTTSDVRMIAILADKYDMIKQLKYFAAYWIQVPTNSSDPYFVQCAWDILIASYMLKESTPFFLTSKAITNTKGSLFKYAMSTHDKELGLKLGMAIEEVRGIANSRNVPMGVCMDCFTHATESFTQKLSKCQAFDKHFYQVPR